MIKFICISLTLLSVLFCLVSLLPYEAVKIKVDSFALDGSANSFTPLFYDDIVFKLRLLAVCSVAIAIFVYVLRHKISLFNINNIGILKSFSSLLSDLKKYCSAFVRNEELPILITLLFIIMMSVVVRMLFFFQPMRYDESYTFINYISKPLYVIMTRYTEPNNHIFHNLLSHTAVLLLGVKPWVIRIPAFISGILIVPLSFFLIRHFYDKYAALIGASIIATSSSLIEYSVNARGYTLISLLFFMCLILANYLIKNENYAAWLMLSTLSAVGFYTVPIMIYPFGVIITWILLSALFGDLKISRKKILRNLFFSIIITVLLSFFLYLPVFIISGFSAVTGNKYLASLSLLSFIEAGPAYLVKLFKIWLRDTPFFISCLLFLGFTTSIIFHRKISESRVSLFFTVLIWLSIILILKPVLPFYRIWLFLLPLFIWISSAGLNYLINFVPLSSRLFRSVTVSLVLLTILGYNVINSKLVYFSDETGTLRDAEKIVIFLKENMRQNDMLVASSPSTAILDYYIFLYNISIDHGCPNFEDGDYSVECYHYKSFSKGDPSLVKDDSYRFIVLVNNSFQQELKVFLDSIQSLENKEYRVRLINQYESAEIFEITVSL